MGGNRAQRGGKVASYSSAAKRRTKLAKIRTKKNQKLAQHFSESRRLWGRYERKGGEIPGPGRNQPLGSQKQKAARAGPYPPRTLRRRPTAVQCKPMHYQHACGSAGNSSRVVTHFYGLAEHKQRRVPRNDCYCSDSFRTKY